MARKTRKCAFKSCLHGGTVNIEGGDEYIIEGKYCYHKDCLHEKNNLALIRSMWHDNISSTVVYSHLNKVITEIIAEGNVTTDYIIHVLQYVIDNKKSLRYPNGLKYYVDSQEILDDYERKTRKLIKQKEIREAVRLNADSPKFQIKCKKSGFLEIFGGE